MNYVNNINKTATGNALISAAVKSRQLAIQNCEIMACIQSAFNSIVLSEVRELVRIGLQHGKDEVPLAARQDLRLITQECDRYDKLFEKTVRRAHLYSPYQDRTSDEYLSDTADMLDDSDSVLMHYIGDMEAIIERKVPKGGPTCPRDPALLKQLMKCTMLNAASIATYECNSRLEPYLVRYPQIEYMKLTRLQNLMDGLYRHITPLNKYGQKMMVDDGWIRFKHRDTWLQVYREKIVFNAYAILTDEKIMGNGSTSKGVITGGLLCDIRNSLYSSRFVDRLIITRDGYDPHIRDHCDSLLTNLTADRSIEVPDATDKQEYERMHPEVTKTA